MEDKIKEIIQLLEDSLDAEVTDAEESIDNQYRCLELLEEVLDILKEGKE